KLIWRPVHLLCMMRLEFRSIPTHDISDLSTQPSIPWERSMKYPTRFVVMAFCALAQVIFAKYVALNSNVSAQQETKPKFRPAGSNAINPRPDEWGVCFKESLSIEECDREIDRILLQYDAKLLHQAAPNEDKPSRYPKEHVAYIQAPAERAKQIGEDEAVESVTQVEEIRMIGPTLLEEIQKATPASNVEPVKGKRPNPNKKPPKSDQPDS